MIEPKLTNTSQNFGEPPDKQNAVSLSQQKVGIQFVCLYWLCLQLIQELGTPHVESFNYMLEEGLSNAAKSNPPITIILPNHDTVLLKIDDVRIYQPMVPTGSLGIKTHKIYPTECRQRASTYKGKIIIKVGWSINGQSQESLEKEIGEVPIMLKSNCCHLNKMNPKELVSHGEHEQEWGGYFIIKGHERLIRMLLVPRRNYPMAVRRTSWKSRGLQFSDLGLTLRSVRDDNTATVKYYIVHY